MNLNQIRNLDAVDPLVSLRDDLADELDIVDCMPAMSNWQKRQGDEMIAELFPTLKPPDPFRFDVYPNPDGSLTPFFELGTPKNAPKTELWSWSSECEFVGKPTLRVVRQGSISRDVVGGDLVVDGWNLEAFGWAVQPSDEQVAEFVVAHACLPLQWIHDKSVVFRWDAAQGLRKPDAATLSWRAV